MLELRHFEEFVLDLDNNPKINYVNYEIIFRSKSPHSALYYSKLNIFMSLI